MADVKIKFTEEHKSLPAFRRWVKTQEPNLSSENRLLYNEYAKKRKLNHRDIEFIGSNNLAELKAGITEFKDPALMKKVADNLGYQLDSNATSKIKKRKLSYNAMGLGSFSFDRALMSMQKAKEFYSEKHSRIVEDHEVKTLSIGNFELKADGSKVDQRDKIKANGKPQVRTTVKEVFAYFPEQKKESKAVDIYIYIGHHGGVTSEKMLFVGTVANHVANQLTKAGIKVKITGLMGTSKSRKSGEVFHTAPIVLKDYNQALDPNLVSVVTSDSRFYRFEGFMSIAAIFQSFGVDWEQGGMQREYFKEILPQIKAQFDPKNERTVLLFGRITSMEEAINDYNNALKTITGQQA